MSKYCMLLTFDGTNYCGWQVQKNGRSVCAAVQGALTTLLRKKTGVTGCGRTDAGVHAINYSAAFEWEGTPGETFLRSLNALLPEDIRAKGIRSVPDGFHPRYSAAAKRYMYKIAAAPYMDPFLRGYAYHCPYEPDIGRMERAAARLVGERDFKAFMASGSKVDCTIRRMVAIDIERKNYIITIYMTANGFLYKMARGIAGTLLDIGRGKMSEEDIDKILEGKNRGDIGVTLPACGLYLDRVYYGE